MRIQFHSRIVIILLYLYKWISARPYAATVANSGNRILCIFDVIVATTAATAAAVCRFCINE